MEQVKTRLVPLLLGILLAVASIVIIGIGAAVAVPADLLRPLVQSLGMFAFSLVNLVTIAVPLAAAYLVVAFASKMFNKKPDALFYAFLLAPMLLMELYFLLQSFSTTTMTIIFPRIALLLLCYYLLARNTSHNVAAQP